MLGGASPNPVLRVASSLLIGGGSLLLGAVALYYGYTLYAWYQVANFAVSETLRVQQNAAPPSGVPLREEPPIFLPAAPAEEFPPRRTSPATHIWIPSIGVDARIVELGTTYDEKGELVWETPKHAVGHHLGTANPGEVGNVVLSGHISSPIRREGNVFSRLPQLKLGEGVLLETSEGIHTYRVVSRRVVEPSEVSVMEPTATPLLTLITCYPDWVYSHRLVLVAEPVEFRAYGT